MALLLFATAQATEPTRFDRESVTSKGGQAYALGALGPLPTIRSVYVPSDTPGSAW